MARARRSRGRIKELDEMINPPAQIGEPAIAPEPSLSQNSAVDYEQAALSDDSPRSSETASGTEPEEQEPGTIDTKVRDRSLRVTLPAPVFLQLEERARRDKTSLRGVVLDALAVAGYNIGGDRPAHRPYEPPMRRPYRRVYAYSDLVRAIVLFSLLSR
jgi:hypothetical protein